MTTKIIAPGSGDPACKALKAACFEAACPQAAELMTLRLKLAGGLIMPVPRQRKSETTREEPAVSVPKDELKQSHPVMLDPVFENQEYGLSIYNQNSLIVLNDIASKSPEGRFDMIFADPPYFLSNGGITCHAGKMVKVDKGDWDKSRGPELNHEFNLEWLRSCQRVLKPHGTIWVTGTHHVIFSVGFAMQQLGYKILNDITWEKPNPPPNLSCRYFTHSTETLLWAAKTEKSKHVFNYQDMRRVRGKQMKTVWRENEFSIAAEEMPLIWTLPAPDRGEKVFGKHPAQKPVALVERCLVASTKEGDLVLDPFLGAGTTAIAAIRTRRKCVGIESENSHAQLAVTRAKAAIASAKEMLPL